LYSSCRCTHSDVARGIPHSFLGVGEEPSRVLVLLVPAGLEEAFADPDRFEEVM
jgi:hypothetical protein